MAGEFEGLEIEFTEPLFDAEIRHEGSYDTVGVGDDEIGTGTDEVAVQSQDGIGCLDECASRPEG